MRTGCNNKHSTGCGCWLANRVDGPSSARGPVLATECRRRHVAGIDLSTTPVYRSIPDYGTTGLRGPAIMITWSRRSCATHEWASCQDSSASCCNSRYAKSRDIEMCIISDKSLAALTNRLVTVRCAILSATESSIQSSDRLVTPAAETMTTIASRANWTH